VNRLRELAAQSAEQESRRDAAAAAARTKQEHRQVIAQSALHLAREWFDPITEALEAIPAVKRTESGNELQFHFEKGLLVFEKPQEFQPISELPFDLVAGGSIRVEMPAVTDRWAGRSHNLWYCDAQNEGEYFWFETAFHSMTKRWRLEPYSRSPHERDTHLALQRVTHSEQVARQFRPLVGAELEAFVENWLERFAQAAEGALPRPLVMPEGSPAGTWRN
jgi:serine/threonine-protein kinase